MATCFSPDVVLSGHCWILAVRRVQQHKELSTLCRVHNNRPPTSTDCWAGCVLAPTLFGCAALWWCTLYAHNLHTLRNASDLWWSATGEWGGRTMQADMTGERAGELKMLQALAHH
jgi:hypothetical protein